eukprot:UN15871
MMIWLILLALVSYTQSVTTLTFTNIFVKNILSVENNLKNKLISLFSWGKKNGGKHDLFEEISQFEHSESSLLKKSVSKKKSGRLFCPSYGLLCSGQKDD